MALNQGGFIEISFQAGADPVTITKNLASWNANISTMAPAWEQVGDAMLVAFDDNFNQEGGFFGGFSKWPQLAPSTVKDRLRKGYGGAHPILHRTGNLRWSTVIRGAAHNIFQVGKNSLVVGTDYPTATFHQYGTRQQRRYLKVLGPNGLLDFVATNKHMTGRGGMPPRPIVGVGFKQTSQIIRILGDYVRAQAAIAQIAIQGGTP